MNSGDGRRQDPFRPRAAVHPVPIGLVRARPRALLGRGKPPVWRRAFDHWLVAGPIFGMLSAIYGYHLSETGWPSLDVATQHIVRQTQVWHGHFVREYFITPAENTLWWALAVPGFVWLVGMVLGMAALGIRAQRAKR